MSGTIVFDGGSDWSASSGTFNWVIDYLASHVEDLQTREQLRLIEEQNFRWLNMSDLPPEGQRQVRAILSQEIVQYSEQNLPDTPLRGDAIELVQELADRVTESDS
jgi:hypothetical protein